MPGKKFNYALSVIILLSLLWMVYTGLPSKRLHLANVGGVSVVSTIPIEEVRAWKKLALLRSSDPAITTCNFEIAAVSKGDRYAPVIKISKGETGIYITKNKVEIKGKNDEELLKACHAFLCLRDNITCPSDWNTIKTIFWESRELNLIVDANLSGTAATSYAELLGVLSYVQSARMDLGRESKIYIHPYLRIDKKCFPQPLHNFHQNLSVNSSSPQNCEIPGLHIYRGRKNAIYMEGGKVILEAEESKIHTGVVILRDAIAPDYIRAIYGMK